MQIFSVGGAIRDALLHQPVKDKDWVVVGATPAQMAQLGYQTVGKDFPVFLHPTSREEYALARTERKTAPGYKGFVVHASPEVSLEEDLARRDLTINAMALPEAHSDLLALAHNQVLDDAFEQVFTSYGIDPYQGLQDLKNKTLRHVTSAFREDPVRILRLARFAARFPDFSIAPETMQLMQDMVQAGEVEHLVPERVWQELAKGLRSAQPSRMLQVLRDCGALALILPEVACLYGVPQPVEHHPEIDTGIHLEMVLDQCARMNASLEVCFAALCHDLGKGNTHPSALPRHIGHEGRSVKLLRAVCERFRVPQHCKELAEVVAREHGHIHGCLNLSAEAVLRLLVRCDALRRPERFALALQACEADARGRLGLQDRAYPQAAHLARLLKAALAVNTAALSDAAMKEGFKGAQVGQHIDVARVQAIKAAMAN